MAVSIHDDLFHAAERVAKRLGLSRSALYRQALTVFLERHRAHAVTEALDAVYGLDPRESRLDPVLEQLQRTTAVANQ